jgi:ADP-ribose pyrophosphatase YjhB (NUDIX family)
MHVPCAGGIVIDADGRLLLIKRAKAPSAGTWSIPGGRCEPGETAEQACIREVAEETGLQVRVIRWIGRVERASGSGPGGIVYDIDDFICAIRAGDASVLRAGDDAADARWATRAELESTAAGDLTPGLLEALDAWDVWNAKVD